VTACRGGGRLPSTWCAIDGFQPARRSIMASFHVMAGPGEMVAHPAIRRIGLTDIRDALMRGFDDFRAKPSHYVFLSLIYPICGVVLVTWSSGANMLPLIFPLVAGFALLGPFFAIGLYEISRRRER